MIALHPGFADPVQDSQAAFRAVLDAMAQPGRIHRVARPDLPPPGLDRATASILLTLVDAESPVFLDGAAEPYRDWIVFHCGAPIVSAAEASFAVVLGALDVGHFPTGSDAAPEDGATIIAQIEALGTGQQFRLAGPGIAGHADFAASGLPAGFVESWAANHALFPRGADLILCAGDRVAALPRSVRVEPR